MQKLSTSFRVRYIFKSIAPLATVTTMVFSLFSPMVSLSPTAFAADTGWNVPTANINGSGNSGWTNPSYAYASDNQYATASNSNRNVQYTNFNIPTILSGSTINGIEVSLEGKTTERQVGVALSYDNGSHWTSTINSVTGNSESVTTVGGSSNNWGRTWSLDNFTNSNFKVRVTSNSGGGGGTYSLDQIQVKIYYTPSVQPVLNPSLANSCGLDVALVLDNSGSIGSDLSTMKSDFNSFVNTLSPSTPTEFSVTYFNDTGHVAQTFNSNATVITTAINGVPNASGSTNWQDGLIKAQSTFVPEPRADHPNVILFASDGQPNRYGNPAQGNGSGVDPDSLSAAITEANTIKAGGTRIITLGIGSSVVQANMEAISSTDAYYSAANFSQLQTTLQQIASDLCGGTITVRKIVDEDGNLQTTTDQTPGTGWTFNVAGSEKTTDQYGYLNP